MSRAHQPIPGAPPIRDPSALQEDCVTPLKQLCEKYAHAEPLFSPERRAGVPASEAMQWTCSLTVPELRRPGGEVALPQCSFRAVGRGRTDAEQQCARQALERATKAGLKAV